MLSPWYITGFCDGEAAFTYSRSGRTFNLYFSIRQKEDNKQIVEAIYKYFNCAGDLYREKVRLPTNIGRMSKSAIYYRVSKIRELRLVLDHFDKYPLQSKKKLEIYRFWREMVLHKLDNYRYVDYDKLKALAEKISIINQKAGAVKIAL